jgi:two-component system NarL family sensor kinase
MEASSTAVKEGSLAGQTSMASRRQAIGAWACSALVIAMCGSAASLAFAVPADAFDSDFSLFLIPIAMTNAALGVLVCLRRPGNRVGWLLLANGIALASLSLATPYAYYALISHPGSLPAGRWAALWDAIGWPGLYVGLMAIAFVFPDGHLSSPSWRRVVIATAVSYVGLLLGLAFAPGHFEAPFQHVRRPTPAYPDSIGFLWIPFYLGVLASLFAAAFAVRSRLRRAVATERLQLLWFTSAALLIPFALVVCILDKVVTGAVGTPTGVAVAIMVTAIPLAVAIGILRYKLFDIELVINRTLVYGTLTVCIVIGYVAIVSGLNALISRQGISGLLAAGLVAAGAQPLRLRLQRRADRWVYGDRSDPYAALTRLGERLQGTLAPDEVVQTVVDSVAEALRLRYTAVEFDRDDSVEIAAAHGELGTGDVRRLPLIYNGVTIANLVVQVAAGRELSGPDERLLDDLAQHAGPAVHAVRLNADLQLSRERLVTAREEERRRLRRDLHDGLGPALAGMALKLDAARSRAGDPGVDQILGELRGETQDAIADVRRVVYELRPPALDELGLVGALREQAARLCRQGGPAGRGSLTVTIEAPETLAPLPAAVEVAAYRIATEALTNVVRHAGARACTIRVAMNGNLEIEVSDNGRGLREFPPGVGMASMRERANELGGSCSVATAAGGGTLVRAELPLEAP